MAAVAAADAVDCQITNNSNNNNNDYNSKLLVDIMHVVLASSDVMLDINNILSVFQMTSIW